MALDAWVYAPTGVKTEDLGPLQYQESDESGRETYAPAGGSQCTRVFLVAWDQRASFIDYLLGFSYLDASNKIYRVLPDAHPEIRNQYATDCTVEGLGPATIASGGTRPAAEFTTAKITANYKAKTYAIASDASIAGVDTTTDHPELHRYVTRAYQFNVEYLSVQGSMIFVTPTGSPPVQRIVPVPPGKANATIGLQYTWTEVPALPGNPFKIPNLDAINNCLGKVNSEVFDAAGGNYPAGTVLFVGVDPKQTLPRLDGETYYWDITFSFLYRNNGLVGSEYAGHNHLFRPEIGYDKLTVDGTSGGNTIYQSYNLNTLFNLG